MASFDYEQLQHGHSNGFFLQTRKEKKLEAKISGRTVCKKVTKKKLVPTLASALNTTSSI